MKTRLTLSLLFLLTIIYSCKKDHDQPAEETNFYLTALKSNNAWGTNSTYAGFVNDTLYLQGYGNEETLHMKIKFVKIGKYSVTADQCSYFTTIGQDVMLSRYRLRSDTVSSVTITAYDPDKQIFTGTFDLSFIQTYPSNQAKINFLNGKFRIAKVAFSY
ncbi:DUF6252 family protein [Mucilaginibacter paludis]|uniref:Lipoprotein n=1 Tax=Mucilaginibacter paludis DSM 18603 TaxID=714943 RepID=H1YF46_9SPHI|nr:DUF6252 family protein [Mucilaginibacter paludis]EHQ25299.1 hypothetical protein Mucpa_1131 [Mucilaginibacter paludis DSM 18603]